MAAAAAGGRCQAAIKQTQMEECSVGSEILSMCSTTAPAGGGTLAARQAASKGAAGSVQPSNQPLEAWTSPLHCTQLLLTAAAARPCTMPLCRLAPCCLATASSSTQSRSRGKVGGRRAGQPRQVPVGRQGGRQVGTKKVHPSAVLHSRRGCILEDKSMQGCPALSRKRRCWWRQVPVAAVSQSCLPHIAVRCSCCYIDWY